MAKIKASMTLSNCMPRVLDAEVLISHPVYLSVSNAWLTHGCFTFYKKKGFKEFNGEIQLMPRGNRTATMVVNLNAPCSASDLFAHKLRRWTAPSYRCQRETLTGHRVCTYRPWQSTIYSYSELMRRRGCAGICSAIFNFQFRYCGYQHCGCDTTMARKTPIHTNPSVVDRSEKRGSLLRNRIITAQVKSYHDSVIALNK